LKLVGTIAYWLFVVSLPLLFLTSTVWLGVNSTRLYEYGFDRYGVSEDTGISREQLDNVAKRLVDYFSFRVETPQVMVVTEGGEEIPLFQEDDQNRELTHLADVRRLFQFAHRVQLASLAYIVIYSLLFLLWWKGRWQDLAKGIRWGCALTLALIAVLGIASVFVDFERLFFQFHYLAFDNPWWVSSGYLPRLFPEQFWQDIGILGAGAIAAEALIAGGVAWAVPVLYRKHRGLSQVAH
jgi:integral membrane protein (TIGR01906 family)